VSLVRTVLICLPIACVASLSLARIHPFGDAGLYAAKPVNTPILNNGQVPPEVRTILVEKCADCHSTQTRVPIYGRFAPASWLMERDIVAAREAMNFSLWDRYSAEQQQTFVAKIAQETKVHEMPLPQYRLIHWNARITDAEIQMLVHWARTTVEPDAGQEAGLAGEGDPVHGKQLFEKRCTGCHALTKNHQGPQLQGVYGRTSGSVPDYAYSTALKKAKIAWDETSLNKWLTDPDAFLPGNNMDFLVSRPQERQDIISYLRQSLGK
jgi:cytochrome c